MDLDDDELKATRRLNGADKYSEANEMFDNEGMWLEYEDQFTMERKNDDNKVIKINKLTRQIDCFGYYTQESDCINLNELKAIYKYCQEKGWI